jgi:hypothetical protein
MNLRQSYRPLRPDLDSFLFSSVGEERDGVPLSVISALTRLGLDPWDEAERLSSLTKTEAAEQLARLIAELPGAARPIEEARELAGGLVEGLPKFGNGAPAPPQIKRSSHGRWPTIPKQSGFVVLCVVIASAALLSVLLH